MVWWWLGNRYNAQSMARRWPLCTRISTTLSIKAAAHILDIHHTGRRPPDRPGRTGAASFQTMRRPLQQEQQRPAMPSHQQRRRQHRPRRSTLLRPFLLLQLLLALAVLVANGRPGPSSTPRSSSRRRLVHRRRLPAAWGETWEFEEDVLEPLQRLGTKVLDFMLRRQPPEEPHPLRMQRWTIYMRKSPFRRSAAAVH